MRFMRKQTTNGHYKSFQIPMYLYYQTVKFAIYWLDKMKKIYIHSEKNKQ